MSTAPVTDDDDVIKNAIEQAHLPSLIAALVHVTGDESLVTGEIKPVYDFFGDGQGGLTDEQRAAAKARAFAALKALRDGGRIAPPPNSATVRKMMNFVAGADIPDRYVPFLEEELALTETDVKAVPALTALPAGKKEDFRVLIVGAGMSGLLAAIRLKQAGVPFFVVDKNKDVGGTWMVNTYPGCRVDNPNHLYSYSFEPNHDWPYHFSTQPLLWKYFQNVADKYDLRPAIRFQTEVIESAYDEAKAMWRTRVKTPDGEDTIVSNAVITAVGQLSRPRLPDIKGIETFKGQSFHSATWDHSVNLKGKRVAVIGTGASAFQFVPEIAPDVAHLTVFQRTAPWLGPTANYHDKVEDGKKWLLKHVPFYAKWYRFWLFWMLTDGIYEFVKADPGWSSRKDSVGAQNDMLREMLTQYTHSQLEGRPELQAAATPNYPPGGKRSVRDNGVWLAALKRPNVETVTSGIEEITPAGLKTKDGRTIDVDIIIYGTGFTASEFLAPMHFKGKGGIDLHAQWAGDARAYLGITVPNFPNLFIMYGPNTNIVVNGSIIFFSECEIRYIQGLIELLLTSNASAIEVKKDVHDVFNVKVDAQNANMAWGAPQVTSWYKNKKGRVTQNWPWPLVDYWDATKTPNPADYELSGS
ncbi:MAG TPA: NAD(P)/FAD-dependent oxidoreductase [Rhizomicrobium sp.]|jgi:4-hydroxyacetophenone monooxygenase|nr:NAD(P)/FAD-dependent oxidoreductase [Rhizomicrobium sp.]